MAIAKLREASNEKDIVHANVVTRGGVETGYDTSGPRGSVHRNKDHEGGVGATQV